METLRNNHLVYPQRDLREPQGLHSLLSGKTTRRPFLYATHTLYGICSRQPADTSDVYPVAVFVLFKHTTSTSSCCHLVRVVTATAN